MLIDFEWPDPTGKDTELIQGEEADNKSSGQGNTSEIMEDMSQKTIWGIGLQTEDGVIQYSEDDTGGLSQNDIEAIRGLMRDIFTLFRDVR